MVDKKMDGPANKRRKVDKDDDDNGLTNLNYNPETLK
jgi:hypothetical protein